MTVSLLAIASIMVLGWVFGIVCDRLLVRWCEGHSEATQDGSEDHDRWEDDPVSTNMCDTCKWDRVPLWNADCYKCNDYDKWEAKE